MYNLLDTNSRRNIVEFFEKAFNWLANGSSKLPKIDFQIFFIVVLAVLFGLGIVFAFTYLGSKSFKLIKASKKIQKYLEGVDTVDDDNVSDFTAHCFSAKAPQALRDSWVQYLGVRFGYPSDIVSDKNVYDKTVKKNKDYRAGIYLCVSLVLLAIFAFWGYGTLDKTSIGAVHFISLVVIGLMYLFLILINRAQNKRCLEVFDSMQEDLDAKVNLQVEKNYATDSSPLSELAGMVEEIIARNTSKAIDVDEEQESVQEPTPIEALIEQEERSESVAEETPIEAVEELTEEPTEEVAQETENEVEAEEVQEAEPVEETEEAIEPQTEEVVENEPIQEEETVEESAEENAEEQPLEEETVEEQPIEEEQETLEETQEQPIEATEEVQEDENATEDVQEVPVEEVEDVQEDVVDQNEETPDEEAEDTAEVEDATEEEVEESQDVEEQPVEEPVEDVQEAEEADEQVEEEVSEENDEDQEPTDEESTEDVEDVEETEESEEDAEEDETANEEGEAEESEPEVVYVVDGEEEDDEVVKPAKLVKLPNLVDYMLSKNMPKAMKIQIAGMLIGTYKKFENSKEDRKIVVQCLTKVMRDLQAN